MLQTPDISRRFTKDHGRHEAMMSMKTLQSLIHPRTLNVPTQEEVYMTSARTLQGLSIYSPFAVIRGVHYPPLVGDVAHRAPNQEVESRSAQTVENTRPLGSARPCSASGKTSGSVSCVRTTPRWWDQRRTADRTDVRMVGRGWDIVGQAMEAQAM